VSRYDGAQEERRPAEAGLAPGHRSDRGGGLMVAPSRSDRDPLPLVPLRDRGTLGTRGVTDGGLPWRVRQAEELITPPRRVQQSAGSTGHSHYECAGRESAIANVGGFPSTVTLCRGRTCLSHWEKTLR
jgi:hypothetical protein